MGLLPDIFGSSSGEKDRTPKRSRNNSNLPSGNSSNDSELMEIMKGKNLDMTSSSIKLTTSKTDNNISVARSNMLESIDDAIKTIKSEERRVFGGVSDEEEQRLEMEVHAAEDNSRKVVNSDIDRREKLIVSSAVLLEASEVLARHIDDLFGLKAALGDRSDRDIREDMSDLWMDVDKIVEMNMPAYAYIHEKAKEEPELVPVTVKSANLFRNVVYVFSALTQDSGKEIQRKQTWEGKEPDFVSSNQTIFRKHFRN